MFLILKKIRVTSLLFLFSFSLSSIYAQAPGNVSGNLGLWLKGDVLTTGGVQTGNWSDAHSSNNHAVFANPSVSYEVFQNINFNKSVNINDEWFDSPLNINVPNLNVFMVYRLTSNANTPLWGNGLSTGESSANRGRQALSQRMSAGGNATSNYTGANAVNRVYLNHINSQNNATSSVYINGNAPSTFATGGIVSVQTDGVDSTHNGIFIGREKNNTTPVVGTNDLNIAEVIAYTGNISQNQRERINSYLAIKYGITINNHNYINSASTVLWNQGTNSGFNNDIVGIARDDNSALTQTRSQSENPNSIVEVSRGSVPNNQALLIGNNGGATNNSTPFQDGNRFLSKGDRINRIWKCQKTGAFNNFNIDIRSSINLPPDFSTGNIFLLVSNDPSFNSNLRAYPLVNFSASNVELNDGEFFTIARSDAALWVKSDGSNNSIAGGNVNSYHDYVLGVNTMTATNLAGGLPNYTLGTANAAINFNPYLTFNEGGRRNFLGKANFRGLGVSGVSLFMVLRRDNNNGTANECMMSYAVGNTNALANEWSIDYPNDMEVFVENTGGNDDNFNITDNIPHVIANIRGNGSNGNFRLDSDNDNESHVNNAVIDAGGRLIFGQEQDNLGNSNFQAFQEYEGDFAEAIVFNQRVSNNDRDAIESYLAIKYGVTLVGDYHLYDGSNLVVTWDRSANNNHRRNVGGIGRDDAFELDQRKSKSQNGATHEVTIEHTGAFPSDASHLIWGSNTGDYDNITSSGAPSGYEMSEKIWKVQNYNDKIGAVSVTLPVPPSLSGQSLTDVRLIVSDNPNFSAGNVVDYTGTSSNNEITFSGVSLDNNRYFSLGISENVGYINLDPGSPNTFEACPGSNVQFNYANLSNHPNQIEFRDTTGAPLVVTVTPVNPTGSGSNRSGTINLTIPSDAGTGNVQLMLNNTVLYNFNGNLVIHNPELNFLTQTNPVCATDTIPLIGFPAGGSFSSLAPNFIINDTLFGNNLAWTNVNDDFINTIVTYTYTPTYINGSPCLQAITKSKIIQTRDNRLNEVIFNYIISDPPSPNQTLDLNANTINSISPNLLDPAFPYPVTFSGTYVFFNNATNRYEFLTDQANTSNPVTISYNNNGCIGEATGNIDVYPPLQIIGLLDTICSEAASFEFTRDTLSDYAYSRDTLYYNFFGISVVQYFEYNEITRVTTDIPSYQGAVDTIVTTPNAERYSFTPINIPPGADTVAMQMEYTTTITTIVTLNGNPPSTPSTRTYSFVGFDTIHIQGRPNPQILNLDSTYCPNVGAVAIQTSPDFEYRERTYFQFRGDDPFGFNLLDTLQQDTIFDPIYHYAKHVPQNDRHLDVELIYTVDRYGCVDKDTAYTRIIAPVQPIFYPQPAYCTSDFPTPLLPTFAPGSFTPFSVTATFLSTPGLDTVLGLFDPSIPGPGNHLATLQMIDNFGCRSEFTDTLFVRVPPQIRLEADVPSRTGFCSNETNIPLNTILLSGNPADTVVYFGAGITGSTLDPSAIFPGSNGGTSPISVVYTDSFGCEGRDDVTLTIRQIPSLKLDSLFNPTQRYCGNDSSFIIEGFVRDSLGQFRQEDGSITGAGVVLINGVYFYDPTAIAVDSVYNDVVQYTYTDFFGCTNTISEVIRVDSIPEVSLTGLNSQYCIDDPTDQLFGLPDSNVLFNNIIYGGPGVNPNTGILTPLSAGTGRKVVFYTFEDRNSCQNTIFDTTIIYGLPTPLFGGYLTQYCTAGAHDTLESFNTPLVGSSSFHFWGTIISDSIGIINPNRDSSGLKTIYYTFTDSVGCSNTDSVNIFIHPSPEIVTNGLDAAYCFNGARDDISVFPSGRLDSSSSLGFTIGSNSIFFEPGYDTDGVKSFTYIYTDPSTTCADTLNDSVIVYAPQVPSYSGLNNVYCRSEDTIQIVGIPTGGTFTGAGIVGTTNNFIPSIIGTSLISYTVNDTFLYNGTNVLVCPIDTVTSVTIHVLPDAEILSPQNNFDFCSTDTITRLVSGTSGTWDLFVSNTGGVEDTIRLIGTDTTSFNPLNVTYYYDTVYYFNPGSVVDGSHYVTYIATDTATGCQDSVEHRYNVDNYTNILFILDSVYCESHPPIDLIAEPANGTFLRNSDTLFGLPPVFVPNPDYSNGTFLSSPIIDTVIYNVQSGACYDSDTQLVRINPVPQVSFRGDTTQTHRVYCLNSNSVSLTPNIWGGTFSGNGVLFGTSSFIPNIAGAGFHPIYYDYSDSITGCSNQFIDTFFVYGMPQVGFDAIGGCQLDSITFRPDNLVLGLNNIFNNQIIDSITNITWEFAPSITTSGTHQNNVIDTINYVYGSPGVYETKLIVENQTYCIDTQIVRLVISPRVNTFPYDESFEASSGDWYAESRDSSHPLLWEWGIDSTNQGIASNRNNRFWSTQLNGTYSESEDAWVYSPCFDIDSLSRPMLKFDYWSDTRTAADGAVLEYQKKDGTWAPFGKMNRGINWFNSSIITGQPGDQNLAPTGWSGKTNEWLDARYKLDDLGDRDNLRLRIAFGSPSVNLGGNFYDGFGFDNFWVGSRTRNVLLETTVNVGEPSMDAINNYVYQLVYHTNINKDLIMLQYHHEQPTTNDQFRIFNDAIHEARILSYGTISAGTSVIDGLTSTKSQWLNDQSFEQDMLKSPKFKVSIDTFFHVNPGVFTMVTTVTALVDIPVSERYRINMLITEDSLSYPNGEVVHAVVRSDYISDNVNTFDRAWAVGESMTLTYTWDHSGTSLVYDPFLRPNRFQAVAFIQKQAVGNREVLQASTSRDVSGYWVGVDQIAAEAELNEINTMNLYPNPAQDFFKVSFDAPLENDYKWKLVGINGVEYLSGAVYLGEQEIQINNYDFPPGVYVFMVYNGHVFSQRKVIINQD